MSEGCNENKKGGGGGGGRSQVTEFMPARGSFLTAPK